MSDDDAQAEKARVDPPEATEAEPEAAQSEPELSEGAEPEAEQPEGAEPEAEQPEGAEPEAEQPEVAEPETEQPETEEPETEQPETEQPETEQPETEQPAAEEPDTGHPEAAEPAAAAEVEQPGAGGRLSGRGWRSQLLVAGMCLLLGFAIVVQVRQTQGDELSSLRQNDLVRLLDEITQRNEALVEEAGELREDRAALLSGSDANRSAEDYLEVQRILAGTAPVEGPGVVVTVEGTDALTAQEMVHMVEELRNAGAEAIELSGVRIVASSYFVEQDGVLMVDGVQVAATHEWRVIGDPATLVGALDIPGGALASFRGKGAQVEVIERPLVQITAIRVVTAPQYASPAPEED